MISPSHELFDAIWTRNMDGISAAVENGADLNSFDENGITIVEAAIAAGPAVLERILDLGADPNACNSEGVPALSIAVASGITANVLALLERGASLIFNDSAGGSAIHAAVGAEDIELIRLLISYAVPETLKVRNGRGNTALELAKWLQNDEIVALLENS